MKLFADACANDRCEMGVPSGESANCWETAVQNKLQVVAKLVPFKLEAPNGLCYTPSSFCCLLTFGCFPRG